MPSTAIHDYQLRTVSGKTERVDCNTQSAHLGSDGLFKEALQGPPPPLGQRCSGRVKAAGSPPRAQESLWDPPAVFISRVLPGERCLEMHL